MQFTKLRLQGFKSFVDPTDLMIMEGLTGVVGPNGCGKSNLLEALRWVMGENRPTQMRGSGMEDVIFAGTDSRSAKHFAEVTLHLDNESRLAPAVFNHEDEIDVVRRITRDIGSAYKVNGKDVRARDVAMMFADAATGSHSPSLVRQGQISELINAKPQARRRVLEDAAGISGLYQRRHEAELKLNAAETNLTRVDDTLDQLASQIRSLERQAKAAQKYKEIAADLRAAEALLAYLEWKTLSERFVEIERQVTQMRGERSAGERARMDREKELIAAQDALPALRDEDAIAAALVQRLDIAKASLDEEEKRAHDNISELTRAGELLARDKAREAQIAHDAAEALKGLDQEEETLSAAAENEDERLAEAAEKATAAQEILTEKEDGFDDLRQELAREEARAQAAERRFQDATAQLEKSKLAIEKSEAERTSLSQELSTAQSALDASGTALTTSETAVETAQAQALSSAETHEKLQAEFDEKRGEYSVQQGELSALTAEKNGLAAILERDSDGNPIIDQINVQSGYEAAFGAAFEHELSASETTEGSGWQNMREHEAAPWPEGVEPLAGYVSAPSVLQNRLRFIGVVPEVTEALKSALRPGQRLVSRNGDLYRWDGFVRMASDGDSASALRLRQRNRLNELSAEIDTLAAKQSAREAEIQELKAALETAKRAMQSAQDDARQSERALTAAIREKHAAETQFERLEGRIDAATHTLENLREENALHQSEYETAASARIAEETLEGKRTALKSHQELVEAARSEMLEKRAALEELRKDRERRQQRRHEIQRERQNWQKRLQNTSAHQSELEARIASNMTAQKAARALPNELGQKRVLLEADIQNAQKRLSTAKEALAAGESARAKADQAHRQAEAELADIRERLARGEAELEGIKSDRDEAAEHIRESYDKAPEALGAAVHEENRELPSESATQEVIARLIRQREALGAVNLRAEEDREEISAEHAKLIEDKSEITEAIAKLRQAIAALNKEGRERLLAAFDEVNTNFGMLFQKLFGGGQARLELVESDDPLNAGLEILCQPPGKKLATLSLLSGGEQTLTALSLIFAVFLTNPSPICVLDEVDAPLDDANVTRFCDMLDEMVRQTQTRFLIITHHALTMSRMHRLFGVTMAEKGVSQLVSVDLGQAEKLVAE